MSALYPVDGQLNLAPDQYFDGVRKRVATAAALVSFSETSQTMSETSQTMEETTGVQVGKRQCDANGWYWSMAKSGS